MIPQISGKFTPRKRPITQWAKLQIGVDRHKDETCNSKDIESIRFLFPLGKRKLIEYANARNEYHTICFGR